MVIRSKLFQSLFRRLLIRSSEVPNWGVVNKATNIKSSNHVDKYCQMPCHGTLWTGSKLLEPRHRWQRGCTRAEWLLVTLLWHHNITMSVPTHQGRTRPARPRPWRARWGRAGGRGAQPPRSRPRRSGVGQVAEILLTVYTPGCWGSSPPPPRPPAAAPPPATGSWAPWPPEPGGHAWVKFKTLTSQIRP